VITIAVSDNSDGETAGTYVDAAIIEHGFYRTPGGSSVSFDPPGSVATVAYSINRDSTICGSYEDSATALHGYLRTVEEEERD